MRPNLCLPKPKTPKRLKSNRSLTQLAFAALAACMLATACSDDPPQKPAPPGDETQPEKKGPLNVVYIEVNNNNPANAKCYTMQKGGQPFFDIAMIFASNINYDPVAQKAVLYYNNQVTAVLNNRERYIKPLQDKGIKVLLSVLGNHQGAGFANFTSRAAAKDFAQQLSGAVTAYGLDGIDFDDEWADYGNNSLPQPNDSSFILLLQELRKLMPNKLITLYDIGPASESDTWQTAKISDYINYAWNPYYGSYNPPVHAGMTKDQLGAAAIWINNTTTAKAQSLAQRTMDEGYGVVMYYDLQQTDSHIYLSVPAMITQKDSVAVIPGCPQP